MLDAAGNAPYEEIGIRSANIYPMSVNTLKGALLNPGVRAYNVMQAIRGGKQSALIPDVPLFGTDYKSPENIARGKARADALKKLMPALYQAATAGQ
jgi:hypothetical protein